MGRNNTKTHNGGKFLGALIDPRIELEWIVVALNGGPIFREEHSSDVDYEKVDEETSSILREIVQRWQASGPDLAKFDRDNPGTLGALNEHLKKNPPLLRGTPGSGGANLAGNPSSGVTPCQEASRLFLMLLLNPEWHTLAGPCARCRNYYIRGRARNKIYCSRSCGTRATALVATRRQREEARAKKLFRVHKSCEEWSSAPTKQDWKSWVCSKLRDVTKTFLTRSVNKGDVKPPVRR